MKLWENLDINDLENEIWKDIPGWETFYQASSLGRIKSLLRVTKTRIVKFDTILKQKLGNGGYLQVKFSRNSKSKMPIVSRLILETFTTKPSYRVVANHINCIRDDNRLCNLNWLSQSQNIRYSYSIGKSKQSGENNNNSKVSKNTVDEIRKTFSEKPYLSQRELGEIFGLKREHIKDIINNKIWKTQINE